MPAKSAMQGDMFSARECEVCRAPLVFKTKRDESRKRFCSRRCGGIAASKTEINRFKPICQSRNCLQCGKAFEPNIARQSYCAKKCQRIAATLRYDLRQQTLPYYLRKLANREGRKFGAKFLEGMWQAQAGKCALTGVQMTHEVRKGRIWTNASIDRIDPRIGYEPSNVQLVCFLVNIMKNDATVEQFVDWCRKVVAHAGTKSRAV